MKNCPFCLPATGLKGEIVHQTDQWYFLDTSSISGDNAGLAITKRHIMSPFEINEAEWEELRTLLPLYKRHLDQSDTPQGYNLGWNVGATGGQTVFHAHLHIVGRYDDEQEAGHGIRYHLKSPKNQRSTPKKSPSR